MAATNSSNPEKLKGNNLYIVLALVTLLAVGGAILISKNLVGSISINTKVITAKNSATKQLSDDLQAAPQLVDSYQTLGPVQKTLADALPLYADFPDLLVTLENMANNSGLTIKSISPSQSSDVSTSSGAASTPPAGSSTTATTVPFSVGFEGSYASLARMLTQLETSARPMRVVDIQMSGTGSDLTGSMDVDTFSQGAASLPFSTETIH